MTSLEKYSGLPIQMREDFSLVFEFDSETLRPSIREFPSMRNYLKNPLSTYWRRDVYHIYRDIALMKDKEKINKAGLEYNITVIPPGKIGEEFVKTSGHYNSNKVGTSVGHPAVFEIIYGRAFFLFQSASPDLERLKEVYLITVERGEKVLQPPGFGVVTINPTDDVLITSEWRCRESDPIHEPYENHNGAAYYVVQSQILSKSGNTSSEFEFAANLNYNQVPPLRKVRPRDLPQYELRSALPMYFTNVRDLSTLDFIGNPENYLDELVPEKLFK